MAVQSQGEVGLGEPRIETIFEHVARPADGLLCRLGHHDDGAAPAGLVLDEPLRRADEASHVHVVTTGVHHADFPPLPVPGRHLAGVGQACLLDDRQGVHVGADKHDRAGPVLDQTHDPELSHPGGDLRARFLQSLGHLGGRLHLLVGQLGMSMEVGVQSQKLGLMSGEPGVGRRGW